MKHFSFAFFVVGFVFEMVKGFETFSFDEKDVPFWMLYLSFTTDH